MPSLSYKGLLLALAGVKDAPLGMMRTKVSGSGVTELTTGRVDRKIPRETIERD